MTTTTIQQTTAPASVTAAQVLRSLAHCLMLVILFCLQHLAQALGTAYRLTLMACDWLNSRHTFGDDSEAVTLSGWQYVGIGAASLAFCLICSLRW